MLVYSNKNNIINDQKDGGEVNDQTKWGKTSNSKSKHVRYDLRKYVKSYYRKGAKSYDKDISPNNLKT